MKKLFAFLSFLLITQIAMADDIVCNTNIAGYFAKYKINTYDCPSGYYLPANTDGCHPCMYGRYCAGGVYTFNTDTDQGIVIGSYNCNFGYFLPANADKCQSCPNGFTCPGGTFKFNPNLFQGLEFCDNTTTTMNNVCAANFPTHIHAIYTPNVHDCAMGYYMPANVDGCVQCLENNYCAGGTYTFNETINQGISECPDGMSAPAGSWECYERLLHVDDSIVYLKSNKITEPSLHVKYDDKIYYANMTTVPTVMNRDSKHYLKIKYNSIEYYVCDDTIYKTDSNN